MVHGEKSSYLSTSVDTNIKAIYTIVSGNLGLVNQYKIQLHQLGRAIQFIFKNHTKRTSYNCFKSNNEQFMHTDEVTDQNISCNVTLFKMALDVINPQLVIDNLAKERELEYLTIEACQKNVCTYPTTMQEKKIEVDTIHKDGTTCKIQRMKTRILDYISKTGCKDFLVYVKRQSSECIKALPRSI